MALLKGFPPSNTISPVTRIPWIVEVKEKLINLPLHARFKRNKNKYMKLENNRPGLIAVCYEGESPGNIFGFSDDVEVTWYKDSWEKPKEEYPEGYELKEESIQILRQASEDCLDVKIYSILRQNGRLDLDVDNCYYDMKVIINTVKVSIFGLSFPQIAAFQCPDSQKAKEEIIKQIYSIVKSWEIMNQ